jgi:hypothetical protein
VVADSAAAQVAAGYKIDMILTTVYGHRRLGPRSAPARPVFLTRRARAVAAAGHCRCRKRIGRC